MRAPDPRRMSRAGILGLAASFGLALGPAAAQDVGGPTPAEKLLSKPESLAFVDVDVYTGDGRKLEKVSVLVEGGKFTAIGKDLEVPPSFHRIDGGCLVPGLVLTGSTASLSRSGRPKPPQVVRFRGRRRFRMPARRSSARATFTPDVKITSKIEPDHEAWADLLRGGVTTHGMRPTANGLSGLGGVVRPAGRKVADMVLADETFLWLGMASNSATKKMIRDNFAKAKQLLEQRKKAAAAKKAAPKPAEAGKGKPAKAQPPKKEAPKKEPPKKEPPKKEPPKPQQPAKKPAPTAKQAAPKKPSPPKEDPRIAVLAKALERKLPVMLGIRGAGDLLQALDALGDTDLRLILYHVFRRGAQDTLDRVASRLRKRKATVVLPVEFGYQPHTRYYSNPVHDLQEAGVPVVLVPGSRKQDLDTVWWRMSEMARAGADPAKLVEAVTLAPAKLLGVEGRVGSIAKGKDANLLRFSRDPFSPAARLIHVYFEGRKVKAIPARN